MSENVLYDIAVIGSGPAGATFARLLSKNFKTIIIDKKSTEASTSVSNFTKPCGGLLAEDAQKALSKFSLALPKATLVDPQIFAVRTIDLQNNITKHYQRFYINLDRKKFDEWLTSLIPDSVEKACHAVCTEIKRTNDTFEIKFKQDGVIKTVNAKNLIGADGASSIVRKLLYPKKKLRYYTSIQQWYENEAMHPVYSCVFDKAVTDCYSWIVSKDGHFVLGGAFPPNDSKNRFELLKDKLAKQGYDFSKPIKTEACLVLRPNKFNYFCTGYKNAFLIGEAAGFISPSSLEGISYALNSAHILAKIFNENKTNKNREYSKKTTKMRIHLTLKSIKSPFMYWSPIRKLVMLSGLKAIDVMEMNNA